MPEWKEEIRRRLAGLSLTPTRESEIVEELAQHLEDRYEELRASGITEAEAYRAALQELSESDVLAGELRRTERAQHFEPVILGSGRGNMFLDFWQDVRYGLRVLRKNLGFTSVAVLTLALGIGANTAIFQLLDAVRLRTLPVSRPQELAEVRIENMRGARGNFASMHEVLSNPIWEQIRARQQAFSGIFAYSPDTFNLSTGGEARFAQALWVSGDFFKVLGVQPVLGRVFSTEDDQRGCGSPGAVISYSFWQREFNGDPSVVGKKLTVEYHPLEIVGVTPESFFGPEVGRSFDVAVPLCSEAIIEASNNRLEKGTDWWLTVMGRLKEGWTVEQAAAQMKSLSEEIFKTTLPANYPADDVKNYLAFKLTALPAEAGISDLRTQYVSPLKLLLAIAGLVLLIACANLANLMLARASAREREVAIRLALGASRTRLIRQLLAESLLLAAIGALLAALLARWLSGFLVAFMNNPRDPLFIDLNANWHVLAFTAGVGALTCALFGLVPAMRATRVAPIEAMKAGGRAVTASRERFSLRRALVIVQVALSLVLVAGALLFSRSLGKLLRQDAGLEQEGVLSTVMSFSRLNLPPERRYEMKRRLLERIRAVPGVEAAADTNMMPLSGNAWDDEVWLDGASPDTKKDSFFSRVSEGYFNTLKMPLLAGRDFDERDAPTATKVGIVNETFVRKIMNGANPIGQRVWLAATPTEPETLYEIVGLTKDAKYRDLREEFVPVMFLPTSQDPRPAQYDRILTRSSVPIANLTPAIKQAVAEIHPDILLDFSLFKTRVQNSLLRERLMATLSSFFGLLALLLACVGLYGVMSYGVAGRTNEIGIRMALGAQPRDVLKMILGEAILLVIIGVGIGLPLVIAAKKLISNLLYGIEPYDPVSIGLAALLMLIVATVAGYIPARRAAKVDPMVALRYE